MAALKPGDLISSLNTHWVYQTPMLWRSLNHVDEMSEVGYKDVAIVLACGFNDDNVLLIMVLNDGNVAYTNDVWWSELRR